ncbi:uncharacterized protein LOC124168437 isoform X2 [Ischnura elegans]|uniref:uncharacterized protein LOC124168437 isoform X2 n=1 Tax=Ischnura elegans TaxID=197161 RepID=UPI001ED87223|nr:uncharacterized protein LOC124168437 isoform X2 [Ischnura elegans]
MLSRRENLLIRPWQERRYYNHRKKVILATPAIDARPPPFWGHVCCKLKSSAKEEERISRIEEDNFRLLQRMGKIMRSSKKMIDDRWTTPQPAFLNRVGIYAPSGKIRKPIDNSDELDSQATALVTDSTTTPRRHSRCSACCPVETKPKQKIPEERVPWDPPKPSISRRRSPVRMTNIKI